MENEPKTGGEKKIEEYIYRIKNGESKDSILKGLPPSFVSAIEDGLDNKNIENCNVIFENFQETKSIDFIKKQRELSDNKKIEEIRKRLGIDGVDNKKDNIVEKYNVSLPNIDEIIKNGGGQLEVITNDKKVEFDEFVITVDGNYAEVMFIRKKDPTQNKGIGVPIYIELGRRLAEKGIKLCSSKAQYGPGHDLWLKLAQLGFTEKTNGGFSFKNENFLNNNEINEGASVKYQERDWKIKEIVNHRYEINGKTEIRKVYNLERDDGYILQEGGVKKFLLKDDFELNNQDSHT